MIGKTIIAACMLLAPVALAAGAEASLLLHLPREVRVTGGSELQLADLGVLRGRDETLLAKAATIAMGRAPLAGEQLAFDRRTILSRLAACGIDKRAVTLTGAEQVAVTRNETLIAGEKLLAAAKTLLRERASENGWSWRLARGSDSLVAPTLDPIELTARLVETPADGCQTVEVAAVASGRRVAAAELLFRKVYEVRQSIARREIAAGELLTGDNVEVRVVASESHDPVAWVSPFGQTTVRDVPAGSVIVPSLLRAAAAVKVVDRNATVQMRIEGEGFTMTALGVALEDGRAGELIRVRNADSKRIVTARVAGDGTVLPVYE